MRRSDSSRADRIHINLQSVAVFLLFLTTLAGQFSLERINTSYQALGWFGEPRIILVVLLAVFALPLIGNSKRSRATIAPSPDNHTVLWLVLVFNLLIYMCISAMWSRESSFAKETVLSLLILMALLFFAYMIMSSNPEEGVEFFLRLFFIASVVYAIGGLMGGSLWSIRGQLAFLWGGSNAYARVVGAGAILAIYFWVRTKKGLWLAPIPVLLLAVMLSGSRGGSLSLLVALLLALFMLVPKMVKRSAILVLVALSILILVFLPMSGIYKQMAARRYPTSSSELRAAYEYSRAPVFSKSLEAFYEAPFIGIGLGGFKVYGDSNYAHNIILGVAAEGGVLGLVFLVVTSLPLITRWRRRRSLLNNVCFILGVFYLTGSMMSGSYYDQRFMWLFFLFYMFPAYPNELEIGRAVV